MFIQILLTILVLVILLLVFYIIGCLSEGYNPLNYFDEFFEYVLIGLLQIIIFGSIFSGLVVLSYFLAKAIFHFE
jgi:hypothetical protein